MYIYCIHPSNISKRSSVLLKEMENDQYFRNEILVTNLIRPNQHAYQKTTSIKMALRHITSKMEESVIAKEIAICAILDIKNAFDGSLHFDILLLMIS